MSQWANRVTWIGQVSICGGGSTRGQEYKQAEKIEIINVTYLLHSLYYDISVSVVPLNQLSITKSRRLVFDLTLPDLFIALDAIGLSTVLFNILPPLISITVLSPVFLPMFHTVHSSTSSWTPFFFLAALVLGSPRYVGFRESTKSVSFFFS